MKAASDGQNRVVLGRITGLHGVRGWLKIFSYSRPRENIFSYNPWLIEQSKDVSLTQQVIAWKVQGKALIAQLDGISDRNMAQTYVGLDITVPRDALPALAKDEYYWCDLIGLQVVNQNQDVLGTVIEIMETGANDVVLVEGEEKYLIPLLKGSVIKKVDHEQGQMLVDWDGEYI